MLRPKPSGKGTGGTTSPRSDTSSASKTSGTPAHSNALKSSVSGHKPPGGKGSPGGGGQSPTANQIAGEAAGGNNKTTTNTPGRHNP